MARLRPATEHVKSLGRPAITAALDASYAAGSIREFYKLVRMRNPSRSYFVSHQGRLHSLKAVVAYALQQDEPAAIARDFHAVDASDRLKALRFNVVHGDDDDEEEARERIWLSRLSRPGQHAFRQKLIDVYGGCPLSGTTTLAVLEAAHVDPVAVNGADRIANGILLRVDLHKLFDLDLLAVNPDSGRVSLVGDCIADYEILQSLTFSPPPGGPSLECFRKRWFNHLSIMN